MELDKQKLLLSYLISDQELFVKVSPILETKYFDPRVKPAVAFIKAYFDEYKAPPKQDQIKVETGVAVEVRPTMTKPEIEYAEDQLEGFCKLKAMEHAVQSMPSLYSEGKFGECEQLMRKALTVSLERDLGLNYFQDPEARLTRLSLVGRPTPTGFIDLDELLGGGINRKEMIIFAAPSGVGKSVTLANLSRNLMKQGLHVVYISLELDSDVVSKRIDSIFTGIPQIDLLKNITKTAIEIKKYEDTHGSLWVKRMPESTTTANHIRAYIKEYQIATGRTPDAIMVDYLDLMSSNQSISAENLFVKDKYISEELRSIANEFNLMMATASQLGRGVGFLKEDENLQQGHIAGGISKVNTTDVLVGIRQNAQQKARNEMLFSILKSRNSAGAGQEFLMQFDPISLVISSYSINKGSSGPKSKTLESFVARGKLAKQQLIATDEQKTEEPAPAKKLGINNMPFQI